ALEWVVVENNALAVLGSAAAKQIVTKKLANSLVGAGIGIAVADDIVKNISQEDLDHLVTLQMMGNDEITQRYLNSLQDKYAPSHTGNQDTTSKSLNNTGGNQTLTPAGTPNHTGNSQSLGQGITHTGNTDGKPDTGGNSTITPLPDGASKDDLAYLAEGRDNRLPIPTSTTASNGFEIKSNTKHTPGAPGFRPNAGVEPRNSLDLFETSIPTKDPKVRLSIDEKGNIHRFFNENKDGNGAFHWSGSSGDKNNALGNRELKNFNKEIKELRSKK
ncbi:hypothetical protein ID853_17560, partial [Xenorhabdus sp. Vera]|nr:hypothetical protein [Xenorhabdus sp. Vera]